MSNDKTMEKSDQKKRLYSLDYLRGLAAIGIMVYHFLSWAKFEFGSEHFLGRVGLYGVSIFYVLSGITLQYVYSDKLDGSIPQLAHFFAKRVFRIFPLLWLIMFATLLLQRKMYDPVILFLNFTGLFGFFRWEDYIGTGVWSIGNEIVFYTFFPVFIILSRKGYYLYLLSVLLFGIYFYFAFKYINPEVLLANQWSVYVNPLNQLGLFLGGYLIGFFLKDVRIPTTLNIILLMCSILFFIFYPAMGDRILIITGFNRVVFTLLCFFICLAFYKNEIVLPVLFHKLLKALGEACYSIYLLHPLIWIITGAFSKYIYEMPFSIRFGLSLILTIGVSYLNYLYFEKYFIGKGNKLINKWYPLSYNQISGR